MTTPNSIRTGSVSVRYVDGSEHTLPVHGITQLQVMCLADEIGVKDLSELTIPGVTVTMIRYLIRAAAAALTFEKIGEIWTPERIGKTLADSDQVGKVFLACLGLSSLPQPPKAGVQTRKQTPYH
jgi:hypothetical protein